MPPPLVVSQAVGYSAHSSAQNSFDDLVDIGIWPAYQKITKVLRIGVYVGQNEIYGIETTYEVSSSYQHMVSQRGKQIGTLYHVDLTREDNKIFVGIFGSQDSNPSRTTLRNIGFLVYDKHKGSITSEGPYPPSNPYSVQGFASLGLIVGFSGTTADNGNLDTLAVYMSQAGGEPFGISTA